jgi:phage gp36-like protein
MAYATLDDLLAYATADELTQLTGVDVFEPDAAIVAAILDDSTAEIDSYLPVGVTVTAGSKVARRMCCFLTLFHLYARNTQLIPSEARQQQFNSAQQWLFEMAMGTVTP